MHKIPTIDGPVLISRIQIAPKVLEATEAKELDIPLIIYFSFNFFEARKNLIFHEGHCSRYFTVFGGKYGMAVYWSEKVAMGGKGAFVNMRLYSLSHGKTTTKLVEISYVTCEKIGTFRSITLGDDSEDSRGIQSFTSPAEFEKISSRAIIFVKTVTHAIE
jgi:hypothetical protein